MTNDNICEKCSKILTDKEIELSNNVDKKLCEEHYKKLYDDYEDFCKEIEPFKKAGNYA